MTKKTAKDGGVDRRGLLRVLGRGTVGGAAAAVCVAVAPEAANAAESAADRVKKRYRETDHVKAYYRTNRY